MHVYLPSTLTELRAVLAAGDLGPTPLAGFAVTPGLREEFSGEDEEELEYAAQTIAAEASLTRISADPDAPRQRVVIVIDVAENVIDDADGLSTGAVEVTESVATRRIASALVDDVATGAFVQRVLDNPDGANAQADLDDHQLLWFAAQELPDL